MEKKKKTKTRTKTGTKAKRSRARKKKTVWKKAVAAAAVLLVLLGLVAAYVWRAGYFSEYFYKGTWINGNDCTYLTKGQVKQILQEKVSEYTLTVTAQEGDSYTITGPQLHLAYVDDRYVDQLLENQEPLKWIRKDFEERSYEIPVNTDYDRNAAETLLRSFPFLKAENIISPQNAYIQEIEDGYSIVPEVVGNAPDEEKVMNLVHEAIQTGKKQVSLAEGGCYQKPDVYRDDEKLVETVNILNHLTEANLTYQVCGETFTIDRALLKSWLIHDEQGAYAIDSEKIEAFINGLADKRDSYGGKRKI